MTFQLCSSYDISACQWETSKVAETSVQLYSRFGAICSQQWFLGFHSQKALHLSYSSLIQFQDSLYYNIAPIFLVSLNIYIWSIWLQTVLNHNQMITWRCQLKEPGNVLEGYCDRKIHFLQPPLISLVQRSCCGTSGVMGILGMDWVTGSIYLVDPRVDRHYFLIWNVHSIIPSSCSDALLPSIHRSKQFVWFPTNSGPVWIDILNLCGFSHPGSISHP